MRKMKWIKVFSTGIIKAGGIKFQMTIQIFMLLMHMKGIIYMMKFSNLFLLLNNIIRFDTVHAVHGKYFKNRHPCSKCSDIYDKQWKEVEQEVARLGDIF